MQDFPSADTRGVNHTSQINKCIDHFNVSICHLDYWARVFLQELGTCRILVFDQFVWRPKLETSSCITVSARARISNISLSKETSSAKSKSVNTFFPGLHWSSLGVPCVPSHDPLVLWTGLVQFWNLARHHFLQQTSRTSHRQRWHTVYRPSMRSTTLLCRPSLRSSFHRAIRFTESNTAFRST